MSNHYIILTEINKITDNRLQISGSCKHFISDTRQFRNLLRQFLMGINELRKAIRHLALNHLQRTNLYHRILLRRQTRRLQIKDYIIF